MQKTGAKKMQKNASVEFLYSTLGSTTVIIPMRLTALFIRQKSTREPRGLQGRFEVLTPLFETKAE